jgi:hypothetical protein
MIQGSVVFGKKGFQGTVRRYRPCTFTWCFFQHVGATLGCDVPSCYLNPCSHHPVSLPFLPCSHSAAPMFPCSSSMTPPLYLPGSKSPVQYTSMTRRHEKSTCRIKWFKWVQMFCTVARNISKTCDNTTSDHCSRYTTGDCMLFRRYAPRRIR